MSQEPRPSRRFWIAEERRFLGPIARPLRDFLETEASGGVVLLLATAIALVWANSGWGGAYEDVWGTELTVRLRRLEVSKDLRHWVGDGLMTIFFFVVGLEIKRELVEGELREPRKAALPIVAAAGGMIAPALLYLTWNMSGVAARGWGIPMATDIAFALGVLALLGRRVSPSLKVFLLTLAIADDIGAIAVIALFYSRGIGLLPLGVAVGLLGIVMLLKRLRVWWIPIYVLLGGAIWLATLRSGVHPTIAGVALGLMTPTKALDPAQRRRVPLFEADDEEGETPVPVEPSQMREASVRLGASVPVAERLEHLLHPWTSYVIVPLFALANAGVSLDAAAFSEAASSRVFLGVVVGLVAGKIAGITSFAWIAQRLGVALLPPGTSWLQMTGVAAVAGIGFTVSLFIAGLAFPDSALQDQAKVGILVGSLLACLIGAAILRLAKVAPANEP